MPFDTLVVYKIKDNILYLKDIIATKPYDLNLILESIGNHFSKVILQFIPDAFLMPSFNSMEALTEDYLMISQEFELKCDYFRYPEPQHC